VLTNEKRLHTLRQNRLYFEKEPGVIRIGLFGSYAKGLDKPNSDVDIFVKLKKADYHAPIDILILLETQLETKIDFIRKGPHLRDKFLRTIEREIIYA